jgi:hypothetical protein
VIATTANSITVRTPAYYPGGAFGRTGSTAVDVAAPHIPAQPGRDTGLAMEPTSTQVERAAGALAPFVREWNLSLNPEDLAELAYAVLLHHDSEATWDEIDAAVRAQIEDHRRRAEGA